MGLILPASVQIDIERERIIDRDRSSEPHAKAFTAELQQLDDRLSLVFIYPRAEPLPGIHPGRWHIKRENEAAPDMFIPLVGESDEYMEPTFRIIDDMRKRDLWSRDVMKQAFKELEDDARDQARRAEESRLARVDEIAGRIKSLDSPSILISRTI